MVYTRDEARGFIRAAVDWLSANPEHHVKGIYACKDNGDASYVSEDDLTYSLKDACGFCILGRVGYEAGLETDDVDYRKADEVIAAAELPFASNDLYMLNDAVKDETDEDWFGKTSVCGSRLRGNPRVLKVLRDALAE